MIDALTAAGATVCAFDPEAMPNVKQVVGDKIDFAESQYDALQNADALIIATEWSEFRTPEFEKIISLLNQKVIFDGRNVFDAEQMRKLGFHYESVGRLAVKSL
jgi:UDPglucose 6-dehydrogenase